MKKTGKKSQSKKHIIAPSIIIAIVIIAALTLSYNNLSNPQSTSLVGASVQATSEIEGLQVGNKAADFKLADPLGESITKSNFTGKPLFIFFTATWCTPCQIGAQNLARYDDETGGNKFNVLIVFIDDKETNNQFVDWKKQFGRSDWFVAKGLNMASDYHVQFLDTKYVFDKNGIIKWRDIRPLQYTTISSILSPLF